jgi:VCBS repeat-containing protein
VASSAAITAARAPGTDTLLMTINNANGASQTIAILNGWPTYVALTNQAPTATIDTAAVDEDSVASGSLLLNDVDPDGDTLSVNAVTADGGTSQAVPPGGSKAVQGLYGILTVGSDGSYSYAATGDAAQALASGQVVKETFSYTVTDAGGLTSTAPLEVTVTGTNDAPVAQALAGTAAENGPAITFAANFTDVDAADSHTVSLDTTGVKGKVVLNADGSFTYDADGKFETLNAGQTATETFTYTVDDGQGGTSTETVTVTVVGQNDAPKAVADFNGVVKNGKLSVNAANGVLANDSDVEGNSLTVSSFNGSMPGQTVVGKYGSLTMNADGSYTYQANTKPGALPSKTVAQDHFTYIVSDGNGGSHTERLTITVHDKGQTYTRGTDGANSLTGGKGQDVLDGGNGNDVLNGGNGTDALLGGRGDDTLTGGAGADTFVFNADFGKDVITDFTRGLDRLQFDRDVFADYADMLDSAVQSGADVLIDAGGGNMITLKNVQMAALQAGDFVFV